jgi:hypothetical protein
MPTEFCKLFCQPSMQVQIQSNMHPCVTMGKRQDTGNQVATHLTWLEAGFPVKPLLTCQRVHF